MNNVPFQEAVRQLMTAFPHTRPPRSYRTTGPRTWQRRGSLGRECWGSIVVDFSQLTDAAGDEVKPVEKNTSAILWCPSSLLPGPQGRRGERHNHLNTQVRSNSTMTVSVLIGFGDLHVLDIVPYSIVKLSHCNNLAPGQD